MAPRLGYNSAVELRRPFPNRPAAARSTPHRAPGYFRALGSAVLVSGRPLPQPLEIWPLLLSASRKIVEERFRASLRQNEEGRMPDIRRLGTAIFVLGLLAFGGAEPASSGAYTIDETKFQPSTRDFPDCRLTVPSSFSQRVISFPGEEIDLDVIQQDEKLYCIHLQDKVKQNTRSLFVSGYKFQLIYVNDILEHGQFVLTILFRAGFFDKISIGIVDRKFVVGH